MSTRFSFFLVIIFITAVFRSISATDSPCSPKSSLSSQIRITNQDSKLEISTVLQSLLRKGETTCYELQLQNVDENNQPTSTPFQSDRLLLKITLEDVWQEYEVKKDYNFTIPGLDVKCLCDCPGLDDLCNKNYEKESSCDEHDKYKRGSCFRQYSYGHLSSGCFLFRDSAEVCCSVSIYHASGAVYRAFYLASPRVYYKLKAVLLNHNGDVFNESSYVISPEHGQRMIGKDGVRIVIETSGQSITSLPDSLWVYRHPMTTKLMTNTEINDVSETNLHKLGWFKRFEDPEKVFQINPITARHALQIDVQDCARDEYTWKFDAVGYFKPMESNTKMHYIDSTEFGDPIEEFYASTIEKVALNYRSVVIHPRVTSSITIHATLSFPADVIVHHNMGHFDKFESTIVMDKFGNKILKLAIINGFGALFASVGWETNPTTKNPSLRNVTTCPLESHSITVVDSFKFINQSIKISQCFIGKQRVCLYTFNNKIKRCSIANYAEEYFLLPEQKISQGVKGDKLSRGSQTDDWISFFMNIFTSIFHNWKSTLMTIGIVIVVIVLICASRGPIVKLFNHLLKR